MTSSESALGPRAAPRASKEPRPTRVVIVGGGAAGTLVAIHLLRSEGPPVQVHLVERIPAQLGRGIAYSPASDRFPLNVRATGMSVDPEDPDHFVRWCRARGIAGGDEATIRELFAPRRLFGDYLVEELASASRLGRHGFVVADDRAVAIARGPSSSRITLASGATLEADVLVLAMGNFESAPAQPGYARHPFRTDLLDDLPGDAGIVFVGSGLTTVDHLLTLHERGHRGRIVVLSRHGRFPLPHPEHASPPADVRTIVAGSPGPRVLLRRLRNAARAGVAWPRLVDGLRQHADRLWQAWTCAQREAFLRHGRSVWDIHRHRIPVGSARALQALRLAGNLTILAGRVRRSTAREDGRIETLVALRGGGQRLLVAERVVPCLGPASDLATVDDAFVRSLLDTGVAVPDRLRLGLVTDEDGRVVDRDGRVGRVYAIGPLRRGLLWESTAIGEIRDQAAALAREVAESSEAASADVSSATRHGDPR